MNKVYVSLGDRSYYILVQEGLLDRIGREVRKNNNSTKAVLITDTTVGKLFGQRVLKSLRCEGFETVLITVPDGERSKSFSKAEQILGEMIERKLDRATPVIAVGGGVVGDLAGFVASIFLRGVPLVQIPTTLLAQVDSSIGGKTGVNHPKGKNLIGSFYQPSIVLVDPEVLKTLSKRQLISGLAEVVKYGVIKDKKLFEFIEKNYQRLIDTDTKALREVIKRCCKIKADIVSLDEHEKTGLRCLLNFGHTIGHAIETATGYKRFSHGEAISVGMAQAAKISKRLINTPKEDVDRLEDLLLKIGLTVEYRKTKGKNLLEIIRSDKKVKGKKINFVLMKRLGKAVLFPIQTSRLTRYLH